MRMRYPCDRQYPFGSSGVMLRTRLCWRCWLACRQCCPLVNVCGVVAHEKIARCCCSVAMVDVAARSSFVNVALLLLNSVTSCRSAAVDVAIFASASAFYCCMSSITTELACPPLVQCTPYPSIADVRGWTRISRNSRTKTI